MRRDVFYIAVLSVIVIISGCAGITEDPTKKWSQERFYREAREKMMDGAYEDAIKYFETLEARFPYGRYSEQAQLEIAYAYYKYDEPALAIAAADRFIRLHPTHPNVDYAYYLKGLVNFRGERGIVNWLLGSSDDLTDRDPKSARESYNAFREVVDRFPNSRYAKDAQQRMAYLYDAQAKYETQVARFYYERDLHVAAINRSKYALENYPRTPATEDALGIMALSYQKMGITQLYDDTLRILKKNFPQSHYLKTLRASAD
ncbi:MAG: outer membrane protein assembly factor BamD [Sulfuricaulis sp.]|uniref:outer membrane protein assembly factor BamD n=1 Tax=Sulfuricaulis sp. TaxID=2003553 RepID=UPI0034A2DE72